jgi:sn-glycerol 3-phosphate transport system substrate-binding protein
MKRTIIGAASAVWLTASAAAAEPVELQWWHAMTAVNADRVNKIAADFNASQTAYKIVPVFKGSYAETMNAGVAAYRAGNAPQIIQIFEVGTATMMAARGAVKPVYQLMVEAGEPFDQNAYLPAVTAYYSTADGMMLSLPFNSSTAITYWNKDAFKKAGLDPEKAPKTWSETFAAAEKLRAAGTLCGLTAGWISWTQIEQFSAWHNIPLATKANGLEGADAILEFNNPVASNHVQKLAEAQKDKSFDYGGRTTEPEGKFLNGECGMIQTSSAAYGIFKAGAKFDFGLAELPYYPDVPGAPQNSIIGGASLWGHGRQETR